MELEFSQPELVGRILKLIDRLGVKSISSRQMNAVIAGADTIMDALRRDDVMAPPGSGLAAWLASDDTGLSSRYMARALCPALVPDESATWRGVHHPHDPADFGRCVRMLDSAYLSLKPRVRETMAAPDHGPVWNALATAWDELEALYREEYPAGRAPKLAARLRAIIDAAGRTA